MNDEIKVAIFTTIIMSHRFDVMEQTHSDNRMNSNERCVIHLVPIWPNPRTPLEEFDDEKTLENLKPLETLEPVAFSPVEEFEGLREAYAGPDEFSNIR
jgi:hypothetical protein